MDERAIWIKNLDKAKESDLYKSLSQRRFHKTPGYGRFNRAISGIVAIIKVGQVLSKRHLFADTGLALGLQVFTDLIVTPQFPVLAIDKKLLDALDQTTVSPELMSLKPVLRTGLILLPQKTLQTPDGDWLDWLVFRHTQAGEYLTPVETADGLNTNVRTQENLIAWAAQPSGITWSANRGVNQWIEYQSSPAIDQTEDIAFSDRISNLVANLLLYFQAYPEDIEPSTQSTGPGTGFGKSEMRSPKILSPRWVGRNYRQPQERPSQGHRKHTSPQMHWRRGHWRRVPVGKGRKGRKWCWIKPVLVNLE